MTFDDLYDKIEKGEITKKEAKKEFSLNWLETASNYIADVNRETRIGIPEIIYGEYKSKKQTIEITDTLLKEYPRVLISRSPFNKEINEHYKKSHQINISPNLIVIGDMPEPKGAVLVISAGAADHPVATESLLTLKSLGVEPLIFEDRGIAHPTRVLDAVKTGIERDVSSVIVVAGMEGALAPFVASLVSLPVIGVPTSVGYGFRAKEAALTSMLASCAPNLAVVNIDGGVRAAIITGLITKNRDICTN
ncbi:nickel pincer cofactor biosynthesis protein LarB [Marinilabiliaceae bacterium ANBcel2]|nr:nickel pincer cofactor biosynthesis protein LarB [Marinilabiliaceae bacterium ANBcel2]